MWRSALRRWCLSAGGAARRTAAVRCSCASPHCRAGQACLPQQDCLGSPATQACAATSAPVSPSLACRPTCAGAAHGGPHRTGLAAAAAAHLHSLPERGGAQGAVAPAWWLVCWLLSSECAAMACRLASSWLAAHTVQRAVLCSQCHCMCRCCARMHSTSPAWDNILQDPAVSSL